MQINKLSHVQFATVTKSDLTRMIEFFEQHPDRHVTGVMARDKAGLAINPTDPRAHCFCFAGWLMYDKAPNTSPTLLPGQYISYTGRINAVMVEAAPEGPGRGGLIVLNDTSTMTLPEKLEVLRTIIPKLPTNAAP